MLGNKRATGKIMIKNNLWEEYLSIIGGFRKHLEHRMGKTSSGNASSLQKFYQEIKDCRQCPLYKARNNLVFGDGSPDAMVMFVGEAPGKDEDMQGKPFVGAAGKLLRESLRDMGIPESTLYIANILKCRPPGNRDPNPEEIASCLPHLGKQIQIIQPKIICSLGKFSTQTLLNTARGITSLRGQTFTLHDDIILIPAYHPAACIYRPPLKKQFLEDLKKVKEELDRCGIILSRK